MRTIFVATLMLIFSIAMVFAEGGVPAEGTKFVGAKIAIDDAGGADLGFLGTFELIAKDDLLNLGELETGLGYGGSIGFSSNDFKTGNLNTLMLGGNGYLHVDFLNSDVIDTYLMAVLSLYRTSWTYDSDLIDDKSDTEFEFELYLGGRYYFSENLAAVAEIGNGFGTIRLGIDIAL